MSCSLYSNRSVSGLAGLTTAYYSIIFRSGCGAMVAECWRSAGEVRVVELCHGPMTVRIRHPDQAARSCSGRQLGSETIEWSIKHSTV